jgi:hypothetical protein
MTNPKPYWKIGRHPREDVFKARFQKLKPVHQWRVMRTLNDNMRYNKDPTKTYKHEECKECKKGLFLFGVADDGLGNKGVELMVFFDFKKKVLYPIFCRLVTIKK